VQLPLSRNSW